MNFEKACKPFYFFSHSLLMYLFTKNWKTTLQSFKQLYKHCNPKKTMVCFDLDDIIMTPPKTVSTTWWNTYKEKDKEDIYIRTLHEQKSKLINDEIPTFINSLQENETATVGITARMPMVAIPTLRDLHSFGIEFDKVHKLPNSIYDCSTDKLLLNNVFFLGGASKGQTIANISDNSEYIFFIDDQYSNIIDVMRHTKYLKKIVYVFRITDHIQ